VISLAPGHSACTSRPGVGKLVAQPNSRVVRPQACEQTGHAGRARNVRAHHRRKGIMPRRPCVIVAFASFVLIGMPGVAIRLVSGTGSTGATSPNRDSA